MPQVSQGILANAMAIHMVVVAILVCVQKQTFVGLGNRRFE